MKKKLIPIVLLMGIIGCTNSANNTIPKNRTLVSDTIQITDTKNMIVFDCDYMGEIPPGDDPKLFAPGVISTCKEHSSLMISPDGKEMVFGRMFPVQTYTLQNNNGMWTNPEPLEFGNYGCIYPSLSPDGKKIFFVSPVSLEDSSKRIPRGQGNIWYTKKENSIWTQPVFAGGNININNRQGSSSVAHDGTIFFSSFDTQSPNTSSDIYFAEYSDGVFSEAQKIGGMINSQFPDHSPFIAPDKSYIIFSSFNNSMGLSDLFISFQLVDNKWAIPQNLGNKINSSAKDEYPYVTPDGKYLFFNSNRVSVLNSKNIPDGPGNIYWVKADIIQLIREKVLK